MLKRDDDSFLKVALDLEVSGKRKRGSPKKTWKKQVEEETEKIRLKKKNRLNRAVERRSASYGRRNGVNPGISTKATISNKN